MRCFLGHRGPSRDVDVLGAPWCWGVAGGGTHIPLFHAVGKQAGLGQWVTPSSRFLAGKDGTLLSPQLVPCVVQVGDEVETSPCLRCVDPQAVLGRVWLMRFQTLRVLHEGRRGARLGSGEPQQRLNRSSFGSVLCFSFPDQVCPQRCPGCATQRAGGEGSGHGSGGAGGFQRTQVHSFPPERDFRLDVSWFACAPTAVGGSPGGWQHLEVSRVGEKCQGPSPRVQVLMP